MRGEGNPTSIHAGALASGAINLDQSFQALVARMARLTDELDALTKDMPAKK